MPLCEFWEAKDRARACAAVAGLLFAAGWWWFIGATSTNRALRVKCTGNLEPAGCDLAAGACFMSTGPYKGGPTVAKEYTAGATTGTCCADPATPTKLLPCEQPVIFGYYMPGICMTLMFFMVTGMDWGALGADEMTYHGGTGTALKAKGFLLFAVLIATDTVNVIAAFLLDHFDWSATLS